MLEKNRAKTGLPKGMWAFFVLIAFVAIGNGFSDSVFANYFKEAYNVTPVQRGFLEFPRESPGMICALIIAAMAGMGDLKASLLAQVLAFLGLLVLALTTPSFNVMMIFLFINSLGMHMFFPLQDAIGMELSEPDRIGQRIGQFASVRSVVGFACGIVVFFGFRSGAFSFVTPIKTVFLLGALGFLLAIVASILLIRQFHGQVAERPARKFRLLFRREYKYYYYLAVLQGVQKQITYVYGSWVIIDILLKGTDLMSILYIVANFLSIFFMQLIGRLLDRYGVKKMMFANAFALILVYVVYGVVALSIMNSWMPQNALTLGMVYALFIVDRVTMQLSVIRAVYLRSIAKDGNDVTATLGTGTSLDHLVAIIAAPLCGLIWASWGPHWVFFIAAFCSIANVYVAWKVE